MENKVSKSDPKTILPVLLSALRAQHWMYYTLHWQASGENFYSNHLLFERLYGSLGEEIDGLAEKMVGLGGDYFVCVKTIMGITAKILDHVSEMNENTLGYEMAQQALKLEKIFLSYTKRLYNKMEEDGSLTLGFDDMLMALHNSHERNAYLLKQRVKRA